MRYFILILTAMALMSFVVVKPIPHRAERFVPFIGSVTVQIQGVTSFNYYVDATLGSDANVGTSAGQAWKTLAKVNSSTYSYGDAIYFKRGETWYGSLVVNRSGLTFGAYGSSLVRPLITGYSTVSSLTPTGNNKYFAVVDRMPSTLNMVTLDDSVQIMGRFPNVDSLQRGWQPCGVSGSNLSNTSFIIGVPAGTYYPGQNVMIKNIGYDIENCIIDSVKHDTMWYRQNPDYTGGTALVSRGVANKFFFRQYASRRDSIWLNRDGNWGKSHDTLSICLVGGLAGRVLKVSTVDTAVNLVGKNYTTIRDLAFEGFNSFGVRGNNQTNTIIDNCSFINTGGKAVSIDGYRNAAVINCTIVRAVECAIQMKASGTDSATITGNTISEIGLWEGLGRRYSNDWVAISLTVRSVATVQRNFIRSVGHIGIGFQGSNILIDRNYIDGFAYRLSDNGGIYGHSEDLTNTFTNRTISNNFITNGVGETAGTGDDKTDVVQIYVDGTAMRNLTITGNVVWNGNAVGFQHNNDSNVIMSGNIVYNCRTTDVNYIKRNATRSPKLTMTGNVFYRFPNTSYTADTRRYHIYYDDIVLPNTTSGAMQASITGALVSNGNFYNMVTAPTFKQDGQASGVNGNYNPVKTLAQWVAFSGQDGSSGTLADHSADSARLFPNPSSMPLVVYLPWTGRKAGTSTTASGTFTVAPWTGEVWIYDSPMPGQAVDLIRGVEYTDH